MATAVRTQRPRLAWIKRQARQIERAFRAPRRTALECAAEDYVAFTGRRARAALSLVSH